jgi:hypothetical protein
MRPIAACAEVVVVRTRVSQVTPEIARHSPRNGLRLIPRSPRRPAFLPPSLLRSSLLKNLMPASGHQDHTTSPSASGALVNSAVRVHRIPPHVRDDRETPLRRDGTARIWKVICATAEGEIFLQRGLDRISLICPSGCAFRETRRRPELPRFKLVRAGRRQRAGASDVISVFDRGSGRPACTASGANASDRSAWVICSSGLSIPTASACRVGWMMSTIVRAPLQPGSLQSRSLMQMIVSSSALITLRACFFNSRTAFHWWFGLLGKKRTAIPDASRV